MIFSSQKVKQACLTYALTQMEQAWIGINLGNLLISVIIRFLSKSLFLKNYFHPLLMADFKTVKTFTLLAKIGSGLSLSALFPAAQSSKVSTFFENL